MMRNRSRDIIRLSKEWVSKPSIRCRIDSFWYQTGRAMTASTNFTGRHYSTSFVVYGDSHHSFRATPAVKTNDFRSTSASLKSVMDMNEPSYLSPNDDSGKNKPFMQAGSSLSFHVPQRTREKVISAEDAVALVGDGDTVAVCGFVCQGAPEGLLKALGDRFQKTQEPRDLTLFFGGGPGDYGERGLSHLAKVSDDGKHQMLKRTIGGHYGQTPKVAELVLSEKVEGWTLPMGSISRMIRAQSTHSPGHITDVGINTYVDPDISGGAANKAAANSPLHKELVTKINIQGRDTLMYKALPIHVALIRGTTADLSGNISCEHESLLSDQRSIAAAAKNSPGGLVIAQVKRIAANDSIPAREVAIPGPLVDCVVVIDEDEHDELHAMSYLEKHNPNFSGEIRTPQQSVQAMPMSIRKIIARRAFLELQPNKIINLGIGLPDGIASVAAEEGMLDYITLSTEPGVFGGLPASGHHFGPAYNASSLMEMNQMFDFYDGGGLDITFLGAAEVSANGDVNVSRMSKDRLTGPGGFIDISSCTKNVYFMSSFTASGLVIDTSGPEASLNIKQEGKINKFVSEVYEKTFSGDEAARRGQNVYYITERAVFRRTIDHPVLELIEIAPGVELQSDILDHMDFEPVISPDLCLMDERIFADTKMDASNDFFGSLEDRCNYIKGSHTMYIDLFGITLNTKDDILWFFNGLRAILSPHVEEKGKINIVVSYEGFNLSNSHEDFYSQEIDRIQNEMYASAKRYTGQAFQRARLKTAINGLDVDELFDSFDTRGDNVVSVEELKAGFLEHFQMTLTPENIKAFVGESNDPVVDRDHFVKGVKSVLKAS